MHRYGFLAGVSVFVLFVANAALQGAGNTRTPMLIMAAANILNIALDPLLIFGWGPLPPLGVAGAAVATVTAQSLAAAMALHVLCREGAELHIRRESWRPDWPLIRRIVRIGIPGSGQMLSRSLMGAVIMRIVAASGTAAVAAYGAGMRFHMIILMPAFALGGAAATLVGQNLGAGKPDRARRCAWLAAAIDVVFMVLSAVVMMFFAPDIMRFFNSEPDVVRIGAEYLRVVSPFYVFAAVGIVISRATQGAGDTLVPMFITILSLWGLQVPLALWLTRVWQPPTLGIWTAMAIAFIVQGLLAALWFETGRWRRIRI
ncbi:MAG: MATE family efflux transporter [Lentisphaerae bacterium]|nr:MATE family efflux transporter [Lentisphaerota bacterium]